jgi:hypothetical protein
MPVMARRFGDRVGAGACLLLLTALGGTGCAKKGTDLPGAVYGAQIPVYPKAKCEDAMGGKYSDDIGGPVTAESMAWFFKTSEPKDSVVAWYGRMLSNAERTDDEDAGSVTFKFTPNGAEPDEYISVTVKDTALTIGEVVKPGKRKR